LLYPTYTRTTPAGPLHDHLKKTGKYDMKKLLKQHSVEAPFSDEMKGIAFSFKIRYMNTMSIPKIAIIWQQTITLYPV
jgi:inhibitor of KinA sporulation pathway (predicted exonuclease)